MGGLLSGSESVCPTPPPPLKMAGILWEIQVLGVHYAHRYSRKPPNLGRRKKYTLFENMCVRALTPSITHGEPMENLRRRRRKH